MTADGQADAPEAVVAPPPLAAATAAAEDAPTSILSLPTEVEQQIFAALPTADLAACMATCRAWRASAATPTLWQAACTRRWLHGGPHNGRLSAAEEARGSWHGVYIRRRQADAQAVALLAELQWPDRRQAAMRQLAQLGFPAIRDALQALVAAAEALRQPSTMTHATAHAPEFRLVAAAAEVEAAAAATAEAAGSQRAALAARYSVEERPNAAEWPDAAAAAAAAPCGAAYWARHVQHELCVQHSAQELRRRLLLHDAARAEYVLRDVAASAAAADAAAAAGGPPAVTIAFGAPEMEQQLQRYQAEAGPGQPRLSELSREQLREMVQTTMEEGALALAQVHRPSTDFGWVRRALDGLGAELRRRIEAAGAQTRLDKLRLLNHLLFGPGPPPRHRQFAAIPPPDGFGLEISGNRERYYDPNNSLLDHVLINREGIPISMAVLHAAVGARAGLPIQLLGVPMHVLTALDEEDAPEGAAGLAGLAGASGTSSAAPSRRYFIDVFDGGRIMDRAQFGEFLQGLGLPWDSTAFDAQAMDPGPCWVRMCRNLLHIYREQQEHKLVKAVAPLMACAAGEGAAESVRAQVEVVNACLALEQYEEAAELLRKVTDSPYQVQLVGGAGPLQASALQTMLNDIQEAAASHQQFQMRARRRQGAEGERVLFRAGQVMRHKRYHYRGVIVGWDPGCRASEDWIQQMGVDGLPGGRAQPFYRVLPDPEDRPGQAATYVAQENITLEPLPALHRCKPGFALHPEAGCYFAALAPGGACYLPNNWLRHCYPDDPEE